MPDKPPTMRVQYKKVEKQERSRLEAILIDSTKTEADREFARERLQAIREAAVARAKVRAARRADYVEPEPAAENAKQDVVVEDDYPSKQYCRSATAMKISCATKRSCGKSS